MTTPAILALEDGTVFRGISIGIEGRALGEVVFNTAMSGYQEILTDPSYCRQIVTLTYPHIGNTGTNSADMESERVQTAGLVVRDMPATLSNWRSELSLEEFLIRNGVVSIAEIDTRKLTRILREKGAQAGCIMAGDIDEAQAVKDAHRFPGLAGMDLAKIVTAKSAYQWNTGANWPAPDTFPGKRLAGYHVVAYDFGIKRNILRLLSQHHCRVSVVPATTPAEDVLAMEPDGVFLSNGPGDPEPCTYAIEAIAAILKTGLPVFGICLGHQLLSLASGASTVKMKFGHHGANHPVVDLATGEVAITSQNHGFAVDESSLPDTLKPTHRSLFDESLQGVERTDCPAFGFQGHPEASPGPHDIQSLFSRFTELMQARLDNAPASSGSGWA